jgi:pilus assembly protein Flp/PilA
MCLIRVMENENPERVSGKRPTRVHGLIVSMLALRFLRDESGQDLVEYALVVTLISLGATASMGTLASAFATAFTRLGTKVGTYIS